MTLIPAFDLILAITVLAIAVWTIFIRDAFAAVIGYVVYGLLLSLVWVRLFAVEVGLTEAAIGSGVTGVLLINAAARLQKPGQAAVISPSPAFRLAAGVLCAVLAMALATVLQTLPNPAPTLALEAQQNLHSTGLGNPITAFLMTYRAFDTMLEKIVLNLAIAGVWSIAPDSFWGGAPALAPPGPEDGLCVFSRGCWCQ